MFFNFILPFLILFISMIDDLKSKKIHNSLILVLLSVAIISVFIVEGASGIFPAFGKLLVALGITIPLVLFKIIGGGDMKLYAVLAVILSPHILIVSLVYSFFWGGMLGLIKIILDKKLGLLYLNFLSLLKFNKPSPDMLHSFPFSVSLFLGWLSAVYF